MFRAGSQGAGLTAGLTPDQSKKLFKVILDIFPTLKSWKNAITKEAKEKGYTILPDGKKRTIPGINSRNFKERCRAERAAFASIVKGTAAALFKNFMLMIDENLWDNETRIGELVMEVHDEIVLEVREDHASDFARYLKQVMIDLGKEVGVSFSGRVFIGEEWSKA